MPKNATTARLDTAFGWYVKHALVGTAIACAGAVPFWLERKKPKERQRTWVFVITLVLMLVGAIYGLGFGDWLFFSSVFSLVGDN